MESHIRAKENVKPVGFIRLRGYKAGTVDAVTPFVELKRRYLSLLPVAHDGIVREHLLQKVREMQEAADAIFAANFLGLESATPNKIMQGNLTGVDLLVQYLAYTGLGGATLFSGINYGAIGTGTANPTAADTQLTTVVKRVAIANAIDVGFGVAELQFFFTDSQLANGTYHEVGSFMNATATANSGNIFNHALLATPFVKTTGVDTTLEVDVTLTPA